MIHPVDMIRMAVGAGTETEMASEMDRIENHLIRTGLISTTATIIVHRAGTSQEMPGTRIADLATTTTEETVTTSLSMTTEVAIVATMAQAAESTTTPYAITAHLSMTGTIQLLLTNEYLCPKDCRRQSMHILHLTIIEIIPEMNILRMIQATTIAMLRTVPTHPAGADLLLRETIRAHSTEILIVQRTARMDLVTDHRAKAGLRRIMIQGHLFAVEEKEAAIHRATSTAAAAEAVQVDTTRLHTTTIGGSALLRISSTDIRGHHIVAVAVAVAAEGAASSEYVYANCL